jgi:hypothetical protein
VLDTLLKPSTKDKVQSTNAMNSLSATARAFATYSLVPYLGILFCPGAVVVGTVGVVRSYRPNQTKEGRFVCYASTIVGIFVLVIQLLLWWILYRVPAWTAAGGW